MKLELGLNYYVQEYLWRPWCWLVGHRPYYPSPSMKSCWRCGATRLEKGWVYL